MHATTTAENRPQALPLRTLVYRYFFFGWLFRDVNRGSLLERAAAWRHNRAQCRWLKVYMKRWLVCSGLFYALGAGAELLFGAPQLSAMFYVPSAVGASINAVIGAAWLGLKTFPPPI